MSRTYYSCCPKREQCDLRWTIEAERNSHGADTAVDIELHVAKPEPSFDILLAQIRQLQSPHERQPNLTTVCVAAQHEANSLARRMRQQFVGVVWRVTH